MTPNEQSYFRDEFAMAVEHFRTEKPWMPAAGDEGFNDGLKAGFAIAIRGFGVYKNGTQVIGCLDTPIKDVLRGLEAL